MVIITGATGQVGSRIAKNLLRQGQKVRLVVRNKPKAHDLQKMGAEVISADYYDCNSLNESFQGGDIAFLITPENPQCTDLRKETQDLLYNYREAIKTSGITRIVGLSSMGAQYAEGTGFLEASYLLEHAFSDLNIEQTYVRPAYYYSNWSGYLDLMKEQGILPTFFPPDLEIPMIAPADVSDFISTVILDLTLKQKYYEILGPAECSPNGIAGVFSKILNRDVSVQQVMSDQWEQTFLDVGFSKEGARNLISMTNAVIDGKTKTEFHSPLRFSTDFEQFLRNVENNVR